MTPQQEIFNIIAENRMFRLKSSIMGQTYNIKWMKAIPFNRECEGESFEEYREYVEHCRSLISVKKHCMLVRNDEGKTMGIMAFFSPLNAEINMKGFTGYRLLRQAIDEQLKLKQDDHTRML